MQKKFIIWALLFCSIFSVSAHVTTSISDTDAMAAYHGDTVAANRLLQQKNELESASFWTDDVKEAYVILIKVLGNYYTHHNQYVELEDLLSSGFRAFNNKDSIANSTYTRQLWTLGAQAQSLLKNYDSAINYGLNGLWAFEDANDYGFDYAQICQVVSQAYLSKKELLSAKLYADEACDVITKLVSEGKLNPEFVLSPIQNLRGQIFSDLKHYPEAEACFRDAIENGSHEMMKSAVFIAKNNLANTFALNGKYDDAIELLLSIDSSSNYLNSYIHQNLALVYLLKGDNVNAERYMRKYNQVAYDESMYVIANYSETERESYLDNVAYSLAVTNNLLADKSPYFIPDAFNTNLFARNVSFSVSKALKYVIFTPAEKDKFNQLNKELFTKGISMTERDSIMREIISVEQNALRANPNLQGIILSDIGDLQAVQSNMNDKDALILFCYIPQLNPSAKSESRYGAFVIKNHNITLIPLCEDQEFSELAFFLNPSPEDISRLYTIENARKIYDMIMVPLESELKGVKRVYYSTVGPLATISFDALVSPKGKRIKDVYNLVDLSSPTRIKEVGANISNADLSFVAFGAPTFSITPEEMVKNADSYSTFSGNMSASNYALRGEILRGNWAELPGTKQEIHNILSALKGNGIVGKSFVGSEASEEAFKALSGMSPKILHVATHGFVISTSQQYNDSPYTQTLLGVSPKNDYMRWTGLVFAGGNNTWKGETIPEGVEDGILTADEISRLDLSGTELVVLSACETARGHIDPVEGVWGLQRAFKQAGVKTILMTLWKVPDATTAMFMEEFYKQLLTGMTVRQAVKKAQDYLIANGADDPFYWAPFVVLD